MIDHMARYLNIARWLRDSCVIQLRFVEIREPIAKAADGVSSIAVGARVIRDRFQVARPKRGLLG
jgi:hypothetical protein